MLLKTQEVMLLFGKHVKYIANDEELDVELGVEKLMKTFSVPKIPSICHVEILESFFSSLYFVCEMNHY